MINGDIIVIDKVEDDSYDNKDFKKVTDKAGNTFKIKQGLGGKLKEKWHLLEEGIAIKLKVGTYNDKPFVKDFEVVKDEFVKQAAEKVQTQVKVDRNDSIESQVGQKGGIEILKVLIEQALLTNEEIQKCKEYAMSSLGWAMERIALPNVIVTKIEEAKDAKKAQTDKASTPTVKTKADSSVGDDEGRPETVGEFLTWLVGHGKKYDRAWLRKEFSISDGEILTTVKALAMHNTLKQKEEW